MKLFEELAFTFLHGQNIVPAAYVLKVLCQANTAITNFEPLYNQCKDLLLTASLVYKRGQLTGTGDRWDFTADTIMDYRNPFARYLVGELTTAVSGFKHCNEIVT